MRGRVKDSGHKDNQQRTSTPSRCGTTARTPANVRSSANKGTVDACTSVGMRSTGGSTTWGCTAVGVRSDAGVDSFLPQVLCELDPVLGLAVELGTGQPHLALQRLAFPQHLCSALPTSTEPHCILLRCQVRSQGRRSTTAANDHDYKPHVHGSLRQLKRGRERTL